MFEYKINSKKMNKINYVDNHILRPETLQQLQKMVHKFAKETLTLNEDQK